MDALSSEAVDRLLKDHNDCLRRLLLRHSGYEGSCEADSFVLAFHSPKDALLFAMEAQVGSSGLSRPTRGLACGLGGRGKGSWAGCSPWLCMPRHWLLACVGDGPADSLRNLRVCCVSICCCCVVDVAARRPRCST